MELFLDPITAIFKSNRQFNFSYEATFRRLFKYSLPRIITVKDYQIRIKLDFQRFIIGVKFLFQIAELKVDKV